MELSTLQRDCFLNNGYLILDNFFTQTVCETLMERMHFLIEEHREDIPFMMFSTQTNEHVRTDYFLNSGDKIRFFFEPHAFDESGNLLYPLEKSLNKVGHALHELDPVFRHYSRDVRLKQISQQLGFEKPSPIQSMYIFKQPNIGAEVTCHQDATYLHAKDDHVLGFWFALEDANQENGCLEVIPNSFSTPVTKRMIRKENTIYFEEYQQQTWEENDCIPLEVKQGSLILLSGRLPHKSNANQSNKSRHAYTLHTIDSSTAYPATNWLRWPNGLPNW
ncbi:phytanoyl-CoA dioxygenase family protein [Legionella hackeliae]|uniref:Phytanoyl-CoA dioxygenase domain-containing protein 1 n=1 Tax=Legionella hackeliae TaxID=449 RepID=A0A0A8UXW1_LEGHA|nr:phytanoyl-CoA dioxygenase family protein [Legionella hackeliae]KTD13115.1 phytanoyl-CoA dioxygenase [Legionella hackeliae]CEK11574.1 Phytanoyl-CoA dioxygenase domain-containing protein 1 [Legionella hackeliae]STX48347.1 phytanoyl-CoA dioxygenase [Legionella hackeliae]